MALERGGLMIKHSDNPIAIQSKKWFLAALLQLMQEKQFDNITIGELAEKADLNRSTFYRNFDHKEDVLKMYIDDMATQYIQRLQRTEELDMNKVASIFLTLVFEHKFFIATLKKHGLSTLLLDSFNMHLPKIHELTKNQFPHTIRDEIAHYALAYNAGGMWNMLMMWIDKEDKDSFEDLIQAFKEISQFNAGHHS